MKDKIFLKYWLPTIIILLIIGIIGAFVSDEWYIYLPLCVMWLLLGVQLLDVKYKFKILN